MWKQERDGKTRYFERYVDPVTGKTKTVSVTMPTGSAQSRKKAVRLLGDKIERATQYGRPTEALRLSDVIRAYEAEKRLTVKPTTFVSKVSRNRCLTAALDDDVLIDKVTTEYLLRRLSDRVQNNLTINNHLQTFRTLMLFAESRGMIDRAPCASLPRLPVPSYADRIADKYLEPDELEAVLGAIKSRRWNLIARVLVLSGLRIGELSALMPEDVDGDTLHIRRSYSDALHSIVSTKTATSSRDIHIQPELAACIAEAETLPNNSPYIFGGANGKPALVSSFNLYVRTHNPLDKPVSAHTFRHTHASLLAADGVPLDVISRRLGHSGSKITSDIYIHVTERMKERDAQILDRLELLPSCYQ